MGNTIWTADVNKALNRFQPDVLVMNTGHAHIQGLSDSIIMGPDDVLKATPVLSRAQIITGHMDTVNHTAVNRQDMRRSLVGEGTIHRVAVPEDGEIVKINGASITATSQV